MKARQIQASFNGGEVSPECYARVDADLYRKSCRTSRNGFPAPQGGWQNRTGTVYLGTSKDGAQILLVKFIFSTTQAYVLEFGAEYIRFYKNRALILDTGVAYEVATSYQVSDLPNLHFEYSADVIYITDGSHLLPPMTLSRYGDTNWVLEQYLPTDGPFLDENSDEQSTLTASAVTGSVTLTAAKDLFTSKHVGALWKMSHYVGAQTVSPEFTSTGVSSSISCFTTWRLITHGTWTGKLKIEKSTDGGTTWTALQSYSSADDFNADTYGTEDSSLNTVPFLVRLNMYEFTSGTANIDLRCDAFYQDGLLQITAVASTKSATATVLQTLAATTGTITWAEGAWSDERGYPAWSRFFQDRLGFFGTLYQPMRWDFTNTANYTSFSRNAVSLLDTDGMSGSLTSRQLNAINGVVGFKSLLLFTSGSTWSLQSGDGTAFTPNNYKQDIEEYFGSEGIAPLAIGNEAIFVETHGKVVRNIIFSLATNNFNGADINVLARHLVKDSRIIAMDYQRYPNGIVWMLKDDGELLCLTYMREQEVIAWSHCDTDGLVESIAVIPADGYDEVWLSVNRDGERHIEVLENRFDTDVRLSYFVDGGVQIHNPLTITGISNESPCVVTIPSHGMSDDYRVTINNVNGMTELNGLQYSVKVLNLDKIALYGPQTGEAIDSTDFGVYTSEGEACVAYSSVSGLTWLEGKTVSILADGVVLDQQVVTGGVVDFGDEYYSVLNIGLPYESDLETLDIELAGSPFGTTQGRNVKCCRCIFKFLNSRGGYVGPDADHLYDAFPLRRPESNKTPTLISEPRNVTLGGNYSTAGRVFFRQSDPLPVCISAIIPEINIGGTISDT
jgi:hypothetical protein